MCGRENVSVYFLKSALCLPSRSLAGWPAAAWWRSSVKVLDAASVPQKKSFPPRLLFAFLGGLLVFCGAAASVLLHSRWQGLDANDPEKELALEVFQSVNAHMPWATPNGSRVQALSHRAWKKLVHAKAPEHPPGISRN